MVLEPHHHSAQACAATGALSLVAMVGQGDAVASPGAERAPGRGGRLWWVVPGSVALIALIGAALWAVLGGALVEPWGGAPQRGPQAGVEGQAEAPAPVRQPPRRQRHPEPAKVTHFGVDEAPEGMTAPAAPPDGAFGDDVFFQGAAVGMHMSLPGLSYAQLFKELKALGCTHVSLVVAWSQANIRAVEIGPHAVETMPDAELRAHIREAHAAGLKVLLFPILHIERRRSGEWRGRMKPRSESLWWRSYGRFVLHYADMAREEKVDMFSVGSELLSLEHQEARWVSLIERVRAKTDAKLLYSANWDHFEHVTFWDKLDVAGLTGYFELAEEGRAPTLAELEEGWEGVADVIATYRQRVGRPLIFTEVGYPSQVGAAAHPWDYTRRDAPDPIIQYKAYRAMYEVYRRRASKRPADAPPALDGFFFWNWYGYGGEEDDTYNVRGKPAEAVLRRWFRGSL